MQGVFILIWDEEKTKYLTIQVPCTCINFKILRFSLSHFNGTEFLTVPTFVVECTIFFNFVLLLIRKEFRVVMCIIVSSFLFTEWATWCNSWLFLCVMTIIRDLSSIWTEELYHWWGDNWYHYMLLNAHLHNPFYFSETD
jgi:hypothetical protein